MKTDRGERVLTGLPVSPGIAIGPLHLHDPGVVAVQAYAVAADDLEAERARFRRSVEASLKQIDAARLRRTAGTPRSGRRPTEVHRQMLSGSRLVRGVDRRIVEAHQRRGGAGGGTGDHVESFQVIADPTIRPASTSAAPPPRAAP
jgi:phosphotransferase system enzyme I (PtsI)